MKKQRIYGILLCAALTMEIIGYYEKPAVVFASETRNFDEDVENGLLYSNEEGQIIDKEGKAIPEYDYIKVLEDGSLLMYDDAIMQAYSAGAGGKIVFTIPEPVEYDDAEIKSTPDVFESNITTEINYVDNGVTDVYTEFLDDGNYFDEVVSGAWFGEDGMPLAKYPPMSIRKADDSWWWFYDEGRGIFRYSNIDDASDIDTIKRSSDMEMVYSMLVKGIQKQTDENGNVYIEGTEYYSGIPVVIKGNFGSTILNDDDVLVFARYIGLASDDTPNFKAFYVEIDNGRF